MLYWHVNGEKDPWFNINQITFVPIQVNIFLKEDGNLLIKSYIDSICQCNH